ncbi:MAG TPA: substrate-binding domain-containing protein, partial [Burkholderiaceae bacterium]|nr:substrate-binding domain-containing protein [Burkholderiaceae bacterium]
ELMHLSGIDVVGPLPPEIQIITTFSAGICATSQQVQAARELLQFLTSADAAEAKHRNGMEPA